MEHFKNGGEVQFKSLSAETWITIDNPDWYSNLDYRIKPEPTPLKPWTSSAEIPLGALFRHKTTLTIYMPVAIQQDGTVSLFSTIRAFDYTPQELLQNWEHSTDQGKTWKPCGL